ncbi:MAG TPA: nucleoside diphosphate kinase regulator [Planctomycetes bacterium]|jgi:regulator of nucleoside diphosphate kinase|nr:nucleoside diphosphate kinase regulator [Planctomycetota bacterium]
MNDLITITRDNREALLRLLDGLAASDAAERERLQELQGEIERATVVDAHVIDADIVTMNSRVSLRDLDSGERFVYTLVYPRDASLAEGRISILAPVGTAILGYRAGDVVNWRVPAGMRKLRIDKILFQPEAASGRRSASGALTG